MRLRHEGLDHERTTGHQALGHCSETRLLSVLGEEAEEGVERDEYEREWPCRLVVDHVADQRLDRGIRVLLGQLGQHRRTCVERDDVESAAGQWDCQTTRAGTKFQYGERLELGGEIDEKVDRRIDVADALVPVVVHVRKGVAVRGTCVAIHRTIQWRPRRPPQPRSAANGRTAISLKAVHDGYTYLDHAATTPMRADAVEAMLPFFTEQYANPSGSHRFARQVRKAIDEARDDVADVLGCEPGEVIFTSGGTEADNTAIFGTLDRSGGLALCPAVEHHAVLHAVEARHGRIVGVDNVGRVDLEALAASLDDVALVSVMAVNNEVGTITDLAEVVAVVRRVAPNTVLHTDAVQAACWLDLRTITPHVDLMSLSAHKFGGPKGVGVLVARRRSAFAPLLVGGGQERERRSGTHNVAGIIGLAIALRATDDERAEENVRVSALRDTLVDGLQAALDGVHETVDRENKVAGSAHVCIDGIENEALLYLLDEAGVCASAAAACASGAMEPSHVLAAMGVSNDRARGALRLTLGRTTTSDDISRATSALVVAVQRLRKGRTA